MDQRNELELTMSEVVDAETHQKAQHVDVPHARDDEDIAQVSLCRYERGIRRMEAVRDGMGAKVCWIPEERGLANAKTIYRHSYQRMKELHTRVNHRRL